MNKLTEKKQNESERKIGSRTNCKHVSIQDYVLK